MYIVGDISIPNVFYLLGLLGSLYNILTTLKEGRVLGNNNKGETKQKD
jgi:hypothetical protein